MYDFGKLTGRKETLEVPGTLGTVDVMAFYDANDVEWHEAYRAQPAFDYYLALTDDNKVISFQSDPEQSQIGGYRILGISTEEANGYLHEDGSVYGKQWDGTKIDEPVVTRQDFLPVTPRQLRLTLVRNGYSLASIETAINALPDGTAKEEALIDWEYATQFNRLDPTLLTIASALNLTGEQVDAMWEQALAIA